MEFDIWHGRAGVSPALPHFRSQNSHTFPSFLKKLKVEFDNPRDYNQYGLLLIFKGE
jgi:hypothetical protein